MLQPEQQTRCLLAAALSFSHPRVCASSLRPSRGAPYDPERTFEFGLQRVLDGIEAFVEQRTS